MVPETMRKLTLQLNNKNCQRVLIRVVDYNRMRWTLTALRTNLDLLHRVTLKAANGRVILIDSPSAIARPRLLDTHVFVILWDGLHSYFAFVRALPHSVSPRSFDYVIVGSIHDLVTAYPTPPIPLFSKVLKTKLEKDNKPALSLSDTHRQAWLFCRTRLRRLRNSVYDRHRHLQLCGDPFIVFCGVIRPPRAVLKDLMSGVEDEQVLDRFSSLSSCSLTAPSHATKDLATELFTVLRGYVTRDPERIACAYAFANLLHRVLTITCIAEGTSRLFLSEFGRDKHIDPYDTLHYHQHLYLDFGSTRGPDVIYPRTIDLIQNQKRYLQLRLIDTETSFLMFLSATSGSEFVEICRHHAALALGEYSDLTARGF